METKMLEVGTTGIRDNRERGSVGSFLQDHIAAHNKLSVVSAYFPGKVSDQEYIDAVAHLFVLSNLPAGNKGLLPDSEALGAIVIEPHPEED